MTTFIADVGSNHNRDWRRAEHLIRLSKDVGCAAVKFQLYRGERLYAPEFYDKRVAAVKTELPVDWLPDITDLCHDIGIEFHCTPFDVDAVYALRAWVDAFKIASYSILDLRLIEAVCRQGLPISISTGGASAVEIGAAYDTARENLPGKKITFYHCIPEYPASLRAGMMASIRQLGGPVGYSDHTRRTEAVLAAIAAGARTIEFHIDSNDRAGSESLHGHCWTAHEALGMISAAREFDSVLNGDEEKIDYTEMRKWRADPSDSMRPLKQYRDELKSK